MQSHFYNVISRLGGMVAGAAAILCVSVVAAQGEPRLGQNAHSGRMAASGPCVPQWDTAIGNPGMNDAVWALAVLPNGDLVAGGSFTMAGGTPANRIARWDGAAWHPLGSGLDNGTVSILEVLPNGDLVAAGSFTSADGVPTSRIARWDGSDWHPLGSGLADGSPFSMHVLPDGDLVVGGSFLTAGGQQVDRVARWDGSQWHSMGDGTAHFGAIRSLVWFDNGTEAALYAGGSVTSQNSGLVRWNGNAWTPIEDGLLVYGITAMAAADDGTGPALFVAGAFRMSPAAGPHEALLSHSAKWGSHGWEPLDRKSVNRGVAVFDDGSGPSLYWGTGTALSIVKWDGSWWLPVAGSFNGIVLAMTVYDDGTGPSLYAAGTFTSAAGEPSNRIVRLQHCPPTPPVTHHVPGDFSTIQDAIDAASDGEIVRVSAGTYNETIDFLGKTIVVESEDGPETTTIDATGLNIPAVAVPAGSLAGTTLRGFTVTGDTDGINTFNATLHIDHCIIVDNGVFDGPGRGVYARFVSDLLIDNSIIANNQALAGAGVFLNTDTYGRFRDTMFRDNVAFAGGAVRTVDSPAAFIRCTIENNIAQVASPPWNNPWGAGIAIGSGGGSPVDPLYPQFFIDCDFIGNSSEYNGGGLYASGQSSASIHNCRFIENEAGEYGGGMFTVTGSLVSITGSEFRRNASGNIGGAIGSTSTAHVKDTFFCENEPEHIAGNYTDLGGNVFFDVCNPVLGDLNSDGVVDVSDMLILLAAWGECDDPSNCPADLNGDGFVDVSDMLILLANWG